tara:strand:+ start:3045 stop:3329 length:285 start_codon:yes stop_codon:yes gene_type:complete
MPMSKKHRAANKKRRERLKSGIKKGAKAVAAVAGWQGALPKAVKAGSCVAKGMKRGLSLSEASSACGITKRKSKPLKIKRAKRKARMTKDIKKV